MNLWFGKKQEKLNSEEYEKLFKKMVEVEGDVNSLQSKFKALETNYDNLRGQFNRKLSGIRKEEAKIEDKSLAEAPAVELGAKDLNSIAGIIPVKW